MSAQLHYLWPWLALTAALATVLAIVTCGQGGL
jgi:hypothetical protein